MTPEELAAEFDKRSQNCAVLRDSSSHASPKARLDGKRETYAHCAVLIRQHLCTTLQAAAPDMLAALEAAKLALKSAQPKACIPPDPSVSGWWWLQNLEEFSQYPLQIWWDFRYPVWDVEGTSLTPEQAYSSGYRVLGPVPTFAEVEALTEDRCALGDAIAEVEALREQLHHATNNLDNLHLELTAANAEIARLKNSDLVTVRREDLRHTLSLTYPYIDEDTSVDIDARLTAMEDAAK